MQKRFFNLVFIYSLILLFYFVPTLRITADELQKQTKPPRIYFTTASLNKSGVIYALHGQDNAIRLFLPAMDAEAVTASKQLHYELVLPAEVDFLPNDQWLFPHDKPVESQIMVRDGLESLVVSGTFNPQEVLQRCVRRGNGIELTAWYRAEKLPINEFSDISVELLSDGDLLFKDVARLKVLEALSAPPPVDPKHFRFYLHYGPIRRTGYLDELSEILRRAGINSILIMAGELDYVKAMRERGFYTIIQRAGSYSKAVPQINDLLSEGTAWFEKNDGGQIERAAPYADAVLWDFEPSPKIIVDDPATLALFRQAAGLKSDLPLDSQIIREQHYPEWIEFRQNQLAKTVYHWAEWSRSIKPDIETIVTEGRVNIFAPDDQVDYRKYYDYVTICSPMNWNRLAGLQGMRAWKKVAPKARFSGCINLAYRSVAPVFETPVSVMLQIASAALLGNSGTEIYPGQTMDAENFVAFNRIMGFLGRYQDIIWEGITAPQHSKLVPLPKEDFEIEVGNGKKIRNIYPDWDHNSVHQTYSSPDGSRILAALVNWHASEPCYARYQASGLDGDWILTDPENKKIFTLNGETSLPASQLKTGCIVKITPYDFGTFLLQPHGGENLVEYERVALEELENEYLSFTSKTQEQEIAGSSNTIHFGYDDADNDNRLEFKVVTATQTVWISPTGHIIKWKAGGAELETGGLGLCRDQIWLPVAERGNPVLDSTMVLEKRQIHHDHAELVFSRTVPLPSAGEMVDLRQVKRFFVSDTSQEIEVEVEWHNTSIAMEVGSLNLSFRVHNHLVYKDEELVWIDDGRKLYELGTARDVFIPNLNLSPVEVEALGGTNKGLEPKTPVQFGEYFSNSTTLLTFAPQEPEAVLQVLRWLSNNKDSGTHEWMYRPVEIKSGSSWKTSYKIRLEHGIKELDPDIIRRNKAGRDHWFSTRDLLLFHVAFAESMDALTASGREKSQLFGEISRQEISADGGMRFDTAESFLRYDARGNINFDSGRMFMRLKPLWDEHDSNTRYFLQARSAHGGHLNFLKINDGRLLLSVIDKKKRQHNCGIYARNLLQKDQWHEFLFMWNAGKGRMSIFLDGIKVAERQSDPWEMGEPDDYKIETHGLRIPGSSGVVFGELKIWASG